MRDDAQRYNAIGRGYAGLRRTDPRIEAACHAALPQTGSLVNVGAGSGSYEPTDRSVVAVEPSWEMISQRAPGRAPAVQARAEQLPFPDRAFSTAQAMLTVHHWADRMLGLSELRRVARDRVVILTFDATIEPFWLVQRYFPEIRERDLETMPALKEVEAALGPCDVFPVPVPHDCVDGFLGAYWQRPRAYLDPRVRQAISSFHLISNVDEGLRRLEQDLNDGTWNSLFGALGSFSELDIGYRLVVANVE